ncbi:MAG: cysteine desulfurase [Clostridiales bacterium]|nr:cysteine desulfurase [Clostridiales bacterium]
MNDAYRRPVYLDHAATTAPEPAVISTVCRCMEQITANPSAAYSQAGAARKEMRLARQVLAEGIGADRNEISFTSGGTEANNWVFSGYEGKHVILSAMEHSSVLEAAKRFGCRVTLVHPTSSGVILPESVEKALTADTALISVQYANNETGVLQPIAEIGAIARRHRIHFHCDAVQAYGHVPLNVNTCKVDFLTASAHKLYGPRGIGFLYIRTGVPLPCLISGGGQENGRRSGTENIPAIAGFRTAAELAFADMKERDLRERELMQQFADTLRRQIPKADILCEGVPRLPSVMAVYLPGLSSEEAIAALDLQQIMVSGGAACASAHGQPSHVYRALGLSDKDAASVLRISPGRHTTSDDITEAVNALCSIYQKHKKI